MQQTNDIVIKYTGKHIRIGIHKDTGNIYFQTVKHSNRVWFRFEPTYYYDYKNFLEDYTEFKEKDTMNMNKFMTEALWEAYEGIAKKDGGPFGCVIVKDGNIVGKGHNHVLAKNDCTCHGEMEAIRDACKNLNTFDLSGCELYTTSEPCPMCAGAIQWANINKVYQGCNVRDAERIGFRDKRFYEEEWFTTQTVDRDECLKLFEEYEKTNPQNY